MLDLSHFIDKGFSKIEDVYYDDTHFSHILIKNKICLIIDEDLCHKKEGDTLFSYDKYCKVQNDYMFLNDYTYRFNCQSEKDYDQIDLWLNMKVSDVELMDDGGVFNKIHVDNSQAELKLEEVFQKIYGFDSLIYLSKEYPLSLPGGHVGFIDYVVKKNNGNVAIEVNGVTYHHPQLVTNERYERQLLKQNTLSLMGDKTLRLPTGTLDEFKQVDEALSSYLGSKDQFINPVIYKETRKFKLYEHQENALKDIESDRLKGEKASLIVLPTATGKSQIAIEDMKTLALRNIIHSVLIMVPSKKVKDDWINRVKDLQSIVDIKIKTYNKAYKDINQESNDFYDYILVDEAHHSAAASLKKTIQHYNPVYLLGITATPERLDKKRLEEIYGTYETNLTLEEAIKKNIIPPIRCYRVESNIDLSEVRFKGKDYNYGDLEKKVVINSRNELIVDVMEKYFSPTEDSFKQGLIFCVSVKHAEKLAKMMRDRGISCESVSGDKNNNEVFRKYQNKEIQFLTTCQLISEGWDSPQTEIVVMARPTMSKALYVQQLGRGLRKFDNKECLYCIDVVDNYSAKLIPFSLNALFHMDSYVPFAKMASTTDEYIEINGLAEKEISMQKVNIFTFEEEFKDYMSLEEAARTLFINTGTLRDWIKKDSELASLYLTIGNRNVPYFSLKDIDKIRVTKNLTVHDDNTILEDFDDFIDKGDYQFSFKMICMIYMLKLANIRGEVDLDKLVEKYKEFYMKRLDNGYPVDRKSCVYTKEYLNDFNKIKENMLTNPFEKFERKRFVVRDKDLNIVCFNKVLWKQLTEEKKQELLNRLFNSLEKYYEKLGGLIEQNVDLL